MKNEIEAIQINPTLGVIPLFYKIVKLFLNRFFRSKKQPTFALDNFVKQLS